ncbi:hypothetical protein BY996DRAFT_6424588 [Phakopsora pachyrhizi]|nr:hypothetical protein BY996DRAFT_6424588 [Phakopsora pachyrhizi]
MQQHYHNHPQQQQHRCGGERISEFFTLYDVNIVHLTQISSSLSTGKRRARSNSPLTNSAEPPPRPPSKRTRASAAQIDTATTPTYSYNLRHSTSHHPSSNLLRSSSISQDQKGKSRNFSSQAHSSQRSSEKMPRKNRPAKSIVTAGSLKEKPQSVSHSSPMASTSNPAPVLASGQVLIKTKDKDVEMSIQHSISSGRRSLDAAEDRSGTPAPDHDHNEGSQARHDDSASASELDDQDPAEHDEAHDEYGDVMDHDHPSLNEEDDDDDVDEHEMAALRASEALFGFDRASHLPRGTDRASGSELRGPSQQISGLADLQQLLSSGTLGSLDSMGFSGFRGLGGIMAGFTHRLKNILNSLKARGPGTSTDRLVALQELAEILAVSNEDTLAGYFQTDSFARELVSILRGTPERNELEDEDEDEVALVAALTDGHGDASVEAPNPGGDVEQMLLASRCLANLMEALPGSAHTVVHHGAVPVLCAKLLEINFIDLAEQSLSTLEKVSEELPSSIVREGGLTALLQYLDFFSTNVQRTAVTAAANCCCSVSSENFEMSSPL